MSSETTGGKSKDKTAFAHGRNPVVGVLVVNLGTPAEPTPSAVRRYLAEFLSDSRVVEIPRIVWKIILHGVVLRVRPKKSARAYQRVWTEQGSPLMVGSSSLVEKVGREFAEKISGESRVVLAMRYGDPSVKKGLLELQAQGAERLMVLPLYPQYSGATTGSVADAVFTELMQWRWVPELRLMGPFHDDPAYIRAIANSIRGHWQEKGKGDKLLMSFHGMPRATLEAGDPYYCHCHKTARLIASELDLDTGDWEMAFQSRFGAAEWLRPYVSERLTELPGEGVKHLTVVCPGFSVDCLETLDEIATEGCEEFIAAGGERFEYIPALNDSPEHVELLVARLVENAAGWPEVNAGGSIESGNLDRETGKAFALAQGAN